MGNWREFEVIKGGGSGFGCVDGDGDLLCRHIRKQIKQTQEGVGVGVGCWR
jgi:hypothetical protein